MTATRCRYASRRRDASAAVSVLAYGTASAGDSSLRVATWPLRSKRSTCGADSGLPAGSGGSAGAPAALAAPPVAAFAAATRGARAAAGMRADSCAHGVGRAQQPVGDGTRVAVRCWKRARYSCASALRAGRPREGPTCPLALPSSTMATLSAKVSVARPCVRVSGLRRAGASARRAVAVVARAQGEDAAFVDASRMLMAAAAAAAVAMPGACTLSASRRRWGLRLASSAPPAAAAARQRRSSLAAGSPTAWAARQRLASGCCAAGIGRAGAGECAPPANVCAPRRPAAAQRWSLPWRTPPRRRC